MENCGAIYANPNPFKKLSIDIPNGTLDKTSLPRMKRKWDRWSLCLKPLHGMKNLWGDPLMRMEYATVELHSVIYWIQVRLKPRLCRTKRRNGHSIESNAFSMAILVAMSSLLPFFFLFMWENIFWAMKVFVWIIRTKVVWKEDIID